MAAAPPGRLASVRVSRAIDRQGAVSVAPATDCHQGNISRLSVYQTVLLGPSELQEGMLVYPV
jgi:hypothetical protein